MSAMKDTCIVVCCAFYCTCLVLSLTNVCEMPTLWEGITSMGASIASVNRQIVFKQHLEIETCSSQSFFFYQTSTLDSHWGPFRWGKCSVYSYWANSFSKTNLNRIHIAEAPNIVTAIPLICLPNNVWKCSLYSGPFLAPTEMEYFLGEVFMESKMILGVRIRYI